MDRALGLRIFEATGADIADLGEEHGHRVLRVCGKGTKIVLVPLPPAVGRAIDRAVVGRASGPIPLNSRAARMDRHAATSRLRHLAQHAGVRITRPHPHMLRHTFVTTSWMPGWTCAMSRSPPGTPILAPPHATTGPARTSTGTPTISSPPSWPPAPDPVGASRGRAAGDALHYRIEGVLRANAYAFDSMFTRGLADGLCFGEECRGAVPRSGRNQIERLERELAALSGPQRRTTASLAISTDVCRDGTGGRCSS
jgi:hypothetical protein